MTNTSPEICFVDPVDPIEIFYSIYRTSFCDVPLWNVGYLSPRPLCTRAYSPHNVHAPTDYLGDREGPYRIFHLWKDLKHLPNGFTTFIERMLGLLNLGNFSFCHGEA
jgi:hypothetical protein